MNARHVAAALICAWPLSAAGQAPARPTPAQPSESSPLPVRRVVLYKTGVGYFEHLGNVRDRQDVAIRFTSAQLNDVLKSLTTLDLGKGRVSGISYNSIAPVEQRLGALQIPVGRAATAFDLLGSLRGARVEVTSGTGVAEGRLLSVERRPRVEKDQTVSVESFSILTDGGQMQTFDLTPAVRVRITDRDLRQEIGRYLDIVGSTREQDVRRMVISSTGVGERQLFVSYISEVPVWKSTYRLVIPERGKPLLQGWAIIDNTIGEDWRDVELSLVAGSPQSFIQQISQPYYGRRPVVPLPSTAQMTPQTHQATLTGGTGRVAGTVRDGRGASLPGARVTLNGPSGTVNTATNANGGYELTAAAGEYSLVVELPGFNLQRATVSVTAGGSTTRDVTLGVGSLQETVAVRAETDSIRSDARVGMGGGRPGTQTSNLSALPAPPLPPAAPYDKMQELQPAAQAADLGDLFEYRIKEPVTLRKNQSALVPIVNAEVTAEKVVLWNRSTGSGRPLRAIWVSNGTGYTLDGGSIMVIDGNAFAGEGLVDALKPGERRLVSYAAELGVLVSARQEGAPGRVTRVRVANGIVRHDTEERATWTYVARNENAGPVTLVVEHRTRPEWKIAADVPAAETTPDSHRFRMAVEGSKEAKLIVREVRNVQNSIAITELTEQYISSGMRAGFLADDLKAALKPVIDKRVEVAAAERQLTDLNSQRETIVNDQQRLRENMKALRGSSEEKQLLQRYTRQLDEQENRLESLATSAAQASTRLEKLRGELSALIEKMTFEAEGKPGEL